MPAISSKEGWFVLHYYCSIDRPLWSSLDRDARHLAKQNAVRVIGTFRSMDNCQLHAYSVWGQKADLAFLLIDPDLDHLNQTENDLVNAFPAGFLKPVYSFTSMTEISEYISQERDYDRTLREKEGLSPESDSYQEKMRSFRERIQGYINGRLYPEIPDHRVMCFYPMNKARRDGSNWYRLDFDTRKQLMNGHLITGRKFAGKVSQLVTGSMGLDLWEWGVTLFADDPFYLKQILYTMRYDEVSAVYGEFGDFLVGIHVDLEELFGRLGLA